MRYKMQQKLWSFGNNFTIQDDRGNDVFQVSGKVFSFGDKLSFQDMSGKDLAYIEQKVFSLTKTYELYRGSKLFAQVQKEWTFFKDKYTIDVPGPNDYEVTGSFFDQEYTFRRSGRDVARASKAFFSWSDTYGIDIVDGEDDITILATAVIIDLVCDSKKD